MHPFTVGMPDLFPPMFNPFPDSFEDPQRVKDAWGELCHMERAGKAEHIGVEDEPCPHAGPKGVTVYAHDAGQGPAVGIQRRG